MNSTKIKSLLSLALRARKVVFGYTAVETAVLRGKARLVILSTDAGANLRHNADEFAQTCPVVEFANKDSLGKIFNRNEVAIVAVMDPGFASGIVKYLNEK